MSNGPIGKKRVLASGVFDLLHLGHVKFLEESKRFGGENALLTVIVARDSTVERTKGKTIMSENQRRALVESLKIVDEAILGLENFDVGQVIETLKPDVISLGYDQKEMENKVKQYVNKHKLDVIVVRIGKFEEDELNSSSKIREKIVEKNLK